MGIFNFKFGGKKSASVVGIDIGVSSIKVVQLRKRKGVAVLETYGEIALGPYSDIKLGVGQSTNLPAVKIAEAVTDLIREANVTTTRAGISIPFSSSLVSLISLPALDKSKLASMIPLEARKYIPVPISEVMLDWFIVPGEEKQTPVSSPEAKEGKKTPPAGAAKRIEVLLVAIHNSTLNKYNEIVQATKLDVGFFEIEIFSTIRAVIEQSVTPVMVLDMGSANTKLYIVEYGVVKASHVISSGGQDITQTLSKSLSISVSKAEELKRDFGVSDAGLNKDADTINSKEIISSGLDRIFNEASKVLMQYQKKHNKNISNVILTGGGATLKGILPLAKNHFEVEVSMSNPFTKVESPAFFEKVLKEIGPEFAVAVGLALRQLQEEG